MWWLTAFALLVGLGNGFFWGAFSVAAIEVKAKEENRYPVLDLDPSEYRRL